MAKFKSPTKCVIGEVRFSYLNVNQPKSINNGPARYSASIIISKDNVKAINAVKRAINAAYEEGAAKLKGNGKSVPALDSIRTPLRDGDKEKPDDPAYAHSYFINASSTTKPGVVDADLQPILDTNEIYSGIFGRVSLSMFTYNVNGNRGVSAGLLNILKLRDGERLGGRSRAEDDFADDDDDDDDFLS